MIAGSGSHGRLSESTDHTNTDIEELGAQQVVFEEEFGLKGPMTYTEKARAKLDNIKKTLATKQEAKQYIANRFEEMQDVLKPLEEETQKLEIESAKAQEKYDAILIKLFRKARKKQMAEGKLGVPIGDIDSVLGWMNPPVNGKPGEASKASPCSTRSMA